MVVSVVAAGAAGLLVSGCGGRGAAGSTTRVPKPVSITSARVRTANTAQGRVAYRTIGSGPPLLLIIGFNGPMEYWDPRLVDALARQHRVITFDNAGVGRTQAVVRAPLTIDAMADQTSALIGALHLGRTDVLGWSMGGMIAQALAVRHPSQVRRLVLCATAPGNGAAVRPSRQVLNAFESGKLQTVIAALFPAGRTAWNAYLAATSKYPVAPAVPAATVAAQRHAIDAWWAGTDAAGKKTATIAVPTLIAAGTADKVDPIANSRELAKLIPNAKLQLYSDAGHAFLFQDRATFLPLVESFLGG